MTELDTVKSLINQLKALSENEFELHRIAVLERDLIEGLLTVEIIDEHFQKFAGRTYHVNKSGHYVRSCSLHQDVWQYYHGEIPQGDYNIHHIDWDANNNSVENLQLLTCKEHRRIHANTPPPEVSPDKVTLFTCERCGKTFMTGVAKKVHRFCSRACQRAAQLDATKNHEKTCLFCRKTFLGEKDSKFCSSDCRLAYVKAQVPIQTCPQCGKQFRDTNGKRRKIYCSRECFFAARRLDANASCSHNPYARTVICKNCGKEFKTLHPLKCLCSEKCKKEYQKKCSHIYKKTCPICGKEFLGTKRQKHCSTECRDQARRNSLKLTEKICPICGNPFRTKDKRVKYCSRECYRISKNKAERKPPVKRIECNCLQCGKTFKTTQKKTKYCSRECYHKATRTLPDRICPTCGKKFHPSGKARIFCSRACIRHDTTRKAIIKNCKVCGKEFKTYDKRKKCCSRECGATLARRTMTSLSHNYHIRPIRKCPVCGKEFQNKPIEQIHCSRHCANIARRTPDKKCVVCGKMFHPLHSVKSKYCSKKCACTPLKPNVID